MKNEKNDLRSRFTVSLVKEALVSLLADKPIRNITVAELCAAAKINRGTFYNHFYDIYDVYESVEDDLFRKVYERLETVRTDSLDYSFFRDMMEIVSQNLTFVNFIVANIGENSLLKRVVVYARQKYVADFREHHPGGEQAEIESLFTYIFNGSIGIIAEWLRGGTVCPVDTISKRIDRFNQILVSDYFKG